MDSTHKMTEKDFSGSNDPGEPASGPGQTSELLEDLASDVYESFERLEASRESRYLRRTAVWHVFAFIEGTVRALKNEMTRELFWERAIRGAERSETRVSTKEEVERTLSTAPEVWELAEYAFEPGGDEYDHFLEAMKVRRRFSRSKRPEDLDVSDDEMAHVAIAFKWALGEFTALWKARVEALHEDLPEGAQQQFAQVREGSS